MIRALFGVIRPNLTATLAAYSASGPVNSGIPTPRPFQHQPSPPSYISMKSIRCLSGVFLLLALSLGFQGCVTGIRSTNSGVTTLNNYLAGNLTPMTTFSTTDVIRFYVSITWADVTEDAGWQDVVWNWYKDGQLVGHRENQHAYFKGAPNTRYATQPASALGTGHFRVECLVDGKPIASSEFDIR